MAPSPASDVYSLGVVFYEMLAGSLPFTATSATGFSKMHKDSVPADLGLVVPQISSSLRQIIEKVLSKEPSMRYRTADQLGRVLQNFGMEMGESSLIEPIVPDMNTDDSILDNQQQPDGKINLDIDWINVGLGFMALVLVGGLIPFWVWVYFVFNPPLK